MGSDIEIPQFFLCPISLEIMKDPVILSTGITYDRNSIEKWIFSLENNFCPLTKQVLLDLELIPNHTLRRLIQSWCTLNASYGVERIPTPRPPLTKAQIVKILKSSKSSPESQTKCLQELKSLSSESETNKRCIEAAGGAEFLAWIINNSDNSSSQENEFELRSASDEALSILYNLQLSEKGLKSLFDENDIFIKSLIHVMQSGTFESRTYAVWLLKSMLELAKPVQLANLTHEFFIGLVQLLRDNISRKASKSTLQVLSNSCAWGRNRVKAVEAGAVAVLIDKLLDSSERRDCEMVIILLDQLCQCAEGRAELLKHGAGLAVVSKKILRVSQVASAGGVRILHSIAKFSANPSVVQEMLQLGVVAKLCLVVQVDCGTKTKEKARETLKLHARVWKNLSCLPMNFFSSYPS
ncbi:hypothetical protein LguiB_003960 [Lonicera macranthoides]